MIKINEINTIKELSLAINVPLKIIYKYLNEKDMSFFYSKFYIPKKDGGCREILCPNGELKIIQKNINRIIYNSYYQDKIINSNIQAFIKKRSIISNANIHRHKRYVLRIDMHAFFDTINFGRILFYFRKNRNFKLSKEISFAIAKIACCNNKLPQGSPLSPTISNLIGEIIDNRVLRLMNKYKCDYTRYADDMIFSTNDSKIIKMKSKFLNDVYSIIKNSGFEPNIKKTSIMYSNSRQKVTGIITNRVLGIPKEYRKRVRAMCHSFFKKGTYIIDGCEGTQDQLLGMLSFINQVDKSNNKAATGNKIRNNHILNNRENLYRDFLFFVNFYNNQQPIIITEGKTDIIYLKAAIKKSHLKPDEFSSEYGVEINYKNINYSNTFAYLFGGSKDGGSKMKSIYYYFNNNDNNIEKKFDEKKYMKSNKPIIFLLDNEKNKDKPLPQFLKVNNLSKEQKEELNNNFYTKLNSNGKNIYLVVIPKENDEDCEIEDLFDTDTLDIKINGRSFSRKDENPKTHYNKNVFSHYVLNNYQTINFSKFKRLLEILEKICK